MCLFRRRKTVQTEGADQNMYLIAGLGNPGRDYAGTRHNVGFDAVTALSDKYNIPLKIKERKGLSGRGTIAGNKVILLQPQTYMNNSGECIRAYMDFYKIPPEQLIVICDEIALPPGKLRLRVKGSAGGHNGMKSIIAHIGTDQFTRLRIGVGGKPEEWDLKDFVLGHFSKEDEPVMRDVMARITEEIPVYLNEGAEAAMNRFN